MAGDDAPRGAPPPAEPLRARPGLGRPERGAAEDRQQRGEQGEPGQQHQRDGDGQRGAEAGVEPEGGQQQGEQGGDDGRGGERDRLADPGQGAGNRVVRCQAGAEFFPDPEDQEQPVVGARAEGQDEQHDLGERGHLQAGPARLGDHRPGELGDQHGWGQGQQRSEQRAEHGQQQDQDEHDGQVLSQVDRPLRGLARVSLGGHLTGQVGAQAAGERTGSDGAPQAGYKLLGRPLGAEVDARQCLQLHRLAVPADPEVPDPLHMADRGQACGQPAGRGQVRGGERAAVPGDDDRHRGLVDPLEGGGHPGCLQAWAAGRQQAGVVLLGHAGQRRKEHVGQDGRGQPGRDDDPAEPDGEPPGGGVEPVHANLPVSGGTRAGAVGWWRRTGR